MQVKVKSIILGTLIATTLTCATNLPQASAETSYDDKKRAYDLGIAGAAQLDANNNQKAAELLWQATKIDPTNFASHYNLGIAFSKLKRWPDAWQAYSKALRVRPSDGDTWLAVAEAYYECGDKQRAINMVKDVQQRFKTNRTVMDRASELIVYFAQDDKGSVAQVQNGKSMPTASAADFNRLIAAARAQCTQSPKNLAARQRLINLLLQSKSYKEAIPELEAAMTLDPKDSHYLQQLMRCQSELGDLEAVQQTRKRFVAQFPQDEDTQSIKDEIKYYAQDFKSIRAAESKGQATSDYNSAYSVFAAVDMPLKVYVPDIWRSKLIWSATGKTQSGGQKYADLVEKAFREWAAASNNRLSFNFVATNPLANIECEWTTDQSKLTHSFAAGETHSTTNAEGKRKAIVYILLDKDPKDFDEREFYHTTLHELGHALGLSHSSNPADIMYFSSSSSNKQSAGLSQNDRDRIQKLYTGR